LVVYEELVEAIVHHPFVDFACYREQGYATIVVHICAVTSFEKHT
jgi:hypothetical protein